MIFLGKKFEGSSKPAKYDHYYTEDAPIQCTQEGYEHRWICPGCLEEGHVQLPSDVAFDCKMVFMERNAEGVLETKGQCMCYSKEHGLRKDED